MFRRVVVTASTVAIAAMIPATALAQHGGSPAPVRSHTTPTPRPSTTVHSSTTRTTTRTTTAHSTGSTSRTRTSRSRNTTTYATAEDAARAVAVKALNQTSALRAMGTFTRSRVQVGTKSTLSKNGYQKVRIHTRMMANGKGSGALAFTDVTVRKVKGNRWKAFTGSAKNRVKINPAANLTRSRVKTRSSHTTYRPPVRTHRTVRRPVRRQPTRSHTTPTPRPRRTTAH